MGSIKCIESCQRGTRSFEPCLIEGDATGNCGLCLTGRLGVAIQGEALRGISLRLTGGSKRDGITPEKIEYINDTTARFSENNTSYVMRRGQIIVVPPKR